MSKKIKIFISFIVVITSFFIILISGPVIKLKVEIKKISIPEDIDNYLTTSELKFKNITPGAEKKIIWYDKKVKTEYSIVYIHGFSATRKEIAPVIDIVAKELKANIFYTRLHGHGQGSEAMGKSKATEWINDTIEAIKIGTRIGKKIILASTSTGSSLSTWIAIDKELSKNISALIYLSPNFFPNAPSAKILLFPWGKQLARIVAGNTREWKPMNEGQAKYWTYKYNMNAVFEMISLIDLVDKIDLKKINIPLLVIHSDFDSVISVEKVKLKFKEFGSKNKKRVVFNNTDGTSGHILAGDIVSPKGNKAVVKIILDFLNTVK